MNFITISGRIRWAETVVARKQQYYDIEFKGENCGVVSSLKDTESDDSDALACHRG